MRERKRMRASLVSPLACALSDLGVRRCVSLGELRLCQVGHVRVLNVCVCVCVCVFVCVCLYTERVDHNLYVSEKEQ
jgi:hypothetical protein